MFGRNKGVEDIFEREERLRDELEIARRQLAETVTKLSDLDGQYKAAAAAALDSGDDTTALALRKQIDRLQVKRDGLDARIAELEPQYKSASEAAQVKRLEEAERVRRERFAALVAQAREAAEGVRTGFEAFMRTLARFDDSREKLAEFGTEGLHEIEVVGNAVSQFSLGQMLSQQGWRQRTGGKLPATYLEIVSLAAPLEG
jgi:hypothetical protein